MQNMILEVVSTLAVAIITGAITVLVSFLQSKIKSDRINSSLSRVESLTNATVHQLQQELVNEWKEEGKLTKDQIAHLQNLASEKVWALLDDPAAELIQSIGMDLDGLIKALVEKAVVGMKQDSIELVAGSAAISMAGSGIVSLPYIPPNGTSPTGPQENDSAVKIDITTMDKENLASDK